MSAYDCSVRTGPGSAGKDVAACGVMERVRVSLSTADPGSDLPELLIPAI